MEQDTRPSNIMGRTSNRFKIRGQGRYEPCDYKVEQERGWDVRDNSKAAFSVSFEEAHII